MSPSCRRLLLMGVLYGAYWAFSSQQTRLLIPALPFFAVAASLGAAQIWSRWLPVLSWRHSVVPFVGCLVLLSVMVSEGRQFLSLWTFRPSLSGDAEQLRRYVPDYLQYANEHLPADARVLFLRENRGYFCKRDYVADSFFEASQLGEVLRNAGDLEGARRWLRRQRITHLLVGKGPVARIAPLPVYFTTALLRRTGFRPVFRGALADIYEVTDR